MKTKYREYTILLIILFLGFIYHFKYLNEFPSHIHAWAQADRYALSLGFLDNNLNFFEPQTFIYNHQFPHKWEVPSEETITAVDFPIHDYVPAVIMKLTSNTSPWIFRMYILLYSFLGLFFLFKLTYSITNNYLKSIFIVIFSATSPVYVYYQGGFLPTIPSLSNAIIGIYFYYQFLKRNKNIHFNLSILFLTLSSLSRTTFLIPLIAVLCVEFIRFLKKQTLLIPKLVPLAICFISLTFYFFYNKYLRETFGSIFLNHILPPNSIEQTKDIIKSIYENWRFQYFTKPHYLIFIIALLLATYSITVQKFRFQKKDGYLGLFTVIYFFGCLIFSVLMLKQFPNHDYYFLDSYFLPVILSLIIILSLIPPVKRTSIKVISITAVCLVSLFLISKPIKSQEKRRETGTWDKTGITISNYKNSAEFLDSLDIPKTSKILVIDAVAPNIPFILMQRKGFAIMNTSKENIENALTWDFDYIVLQNEYFISDIYTPYPDILTRIEKIADNGKISICKLTQIPSQQTLYDFIGLSEKKPVFHQMVTFDEEPDNLWQNINPSDNYAFSGNFSGYLAPDLTYGLTYKTRHLPELTTDSRILLFSTDLYTDTVDCEIVVSINIDEKNMYYKTYNLRDIINKKNEWETVSLVFQLPKIESNNYEFALFIYNTGKSELYYDNFGFSFY